MRSKVAIVAVLALATASPASAQGWQYRAAVYAWLSGLDGTIAAAPIGGGVPVEAKFSDLAGFLDFAAAGHFEASTDKIVLLGDVNYVGLGAERDADVDGVPVKVDMDYKQWIFELGGGYRLSDDFDLLVVGRYYIQDLGTTTTSAGGSQPFDSTQNWGDVFLGLRWVESLGDHWWVSLRGDIGTGGSDFAWFGNAGVGYRFSDLVSLGLAYRILDLDYETGSGADYYRYDVALNGLGLVLMFTF